MRRLAVFFVMVLPFYQGGCSAIEVFLNPTPSERKIKAEYDLGSRKGERMLVLVNQGGWLNAEANLSYYLTEAINKEISKKIKMKPAQFVGYYELSEFRSGRSDFSGLLPVEVGKALNAGLVLLVTIDAYEVSKLPEMDYYRGGLITGAALFDTAGGEKLWPESGKSKSVRVGFDVEERGKEAAVRRLADSNAYCLVRYFYDCYVVKFKTADDRSGINWEYWKSE